MSDTGSTVAAGARRAALALHALAPADRRWLLSRLDEAQRARVQPLLDELDALGFRIDPADASALAAGASSPAAMAPVARSWRDELPDEPAWIVEALQGGGPPLAESTRRALLEAAERRVAAAAPGGSAWIR